MATTNQPTVTPAPLSSRFSLGDHRLALFLMLAGVILVYSNTLAWVASFWERPEYSHGYLIPAFACVLLWMRKPESEEVSQEESRIGMVLVGVGVAALLIVSSFDVEKFYPSFLNNLVPPGILAFLPCLAGAILLSGKSQLSEVTNAERWAGVGLIALGLALRLALSWYAIVTAEMLTILPCLLGAVVLIGGWRAFMWAWPAIAFLVFMFPLPDFLERGLLAPLQRFATIASTFFLQMIGMPAFREGNRINIGDLELGVVDACSGLRMLTIFFALSTAITLVTHRPMWERIAIILSAIPIALIVNVARITVTGVLYKVDPKLAERVFHDLAGWVMMPMALGLLYAELQILSHLVQEDDDEGLELMESSVHGHPSIG